MSRHLKTPPVKDAHLPLADRFVLTDIVSHLLRRAHFRAEDLFSAELGRWGLTPRQKALLVMAHQHAGDTQNQLAERIALDRNSFAEMLRRMVARGLLTRVRAANDRRAYAIHLTKKGAELLSEILPHDALVEERVIAPLPPEYRPLFIKCLKMMIGLDKPAAIRPSAPLSPAAHPNERRRRRTGVRRAPFHPR